MKKALRNLIKKYKKNSNSTKTSTFENKPLNLFILFKALCCLFCDKTFGTIELKGLCGCLHRGSSEFEP